MNEVKISEREGYLYEVDFGHPVIADQFKIWFKAKVSCSEHSRSWNKDDNKMVGKRNFWTELSPLYQEWDSKSGSSVVVIKRGLIQWVLEFVSSGPGADMSLKIDLMKYFTKDTPYLAYMSGHPMHLTLSEKWKKIFEGHPRGEFYVESQKEAFHQLASAPGTSVELGTGLGKTEVILALVDHYVGNSRPSPDEWPLGEDFYNVAILVPGNAIREEIYIRSWSLEKAKERGLDSKNHWDVDIDWNNWKPSNRVNIINPVAFMNSKAATKPEAIMWLRNVRKVIVDEAHKMSSDSYHKLFNDYMINVTSSSALSGTLDKLSNKYLHPKQCPPQALQPSNASVVGYSGACRMRRSVEVDTNVYRILCDVSDKKAYEKIEEWEERTARESHFLDKLNCMVSSEKFPLLIKKIWENLSERHNDPVAPLYVPFYGKEENLDLAEKLVALGLNVCFWSSGLVWLNGEKVGSSVEDVKKLAQERAFNILETSSVAFEGADLKGLKAVFTMVGGNNSRTQQPIGRAARTDVLDIYLASDENNPMVSRQTKNRLGRIMEIYKVKNYETLDWRGKL